MPGTNGIADEARRLATELLEAEISQVAHLERIAREVGTQPAALAVADKEISPEFQLHFPTKGASRWVLKRSTGGGVVAVAAAPTIAQVLPANGHRLGGQIVNKGGVGVTLICADKDASVQGAGQIWIAPNGGSWDLRLANLLWCGSVAALCDTAAGSSLTVCEV